MARYREQAIAVHAKLVALESSSSVEAGPLRRTLIDSSVALEDIVRSMVDAPYPPRRK